MSNSIEFSSIYIQISTLLSSLSHLKRGSINQFSSLNSYSEVPFQLHDWFFLFLSSSLKFPSVDSDDDIETLSSCYAPSEPSSCEQPQSWIKANEQRILQFYSAFNLSEKEEQIFSGLTHVPCHFLIFY